MTPDTEVASLFAKEPLGRYAEEGPGRVLPLFHRAEKPASLDLRGDETIEEVTATISSAWEQGFDALRLRNYQMNDLDGPRTILFVRNPEQLRSQSAAFDPSKKQSPDLLAGAAAVPLASPYIYTSLREDEGSGSAGQPALVK